jgi:opacity protein-like surface antigen
MRKSYKLSVFGGLLLVAVGTAAADDDFPKVETSPQFYVFGPRLTLMRSGKVHPFFELNFGGERVSVSCRNGNFGNACGSIVPIQPLPTVVTVTTPTVTVVRVTNPNGTSVAKNAFAMTVGGGVDVMLNKKFALRLFQAEYLYTRFGNDCQFAICSDNNNQNSFRLKSGLVMSWGGAK